MYPFRYHVGSIRPSNGGISCHGHRCNGNTREGNSGELVQICYVVILGVNVPVKPICRHNFSESVNGLLMCDLTHPDWDHFVKMYDLRKIPRAISCRVQVRFLTQLTRPWGVGTSAGVSQGADVTDLSHLTYCESANATSRLKRDGKLKLSLPGVGHGRNAVSLNTSLGMIRPRKSCHTHEGSTRSGRKRKGYRSFFQHVVCRGDLQHRMQTNTRKSTFVTTRAGLITVSVWKKPQEPRHIHTSSAGRVRNRTGGGSTFRHVLCALAVSYTLSSFHRLTTTHFNLFRVVLRFGTQLRTRDNGSNRRLFCASLCVSVRLCASLCV